MDNGIRTDIVTISPDMARKWLEQNIDNRREKSTAIDRYARDMAADDWKLTGQPIIFGASGRLLDGQNRLMACIKANRPFRSAVVRGAPNDSQVVIDSGCARNTADALTMNGHKGGLHLASAISWVWKILGGKCRHQNIVPTRTESLEIIAIHPSLENCVADVGKFNPFGGPGIGGALKYLFSMVDSSAAHQFFDDMKSGAGLEADDPVLVARNAMMGESGSSRRFTYVKAAFLIKAWNARRRQATMRLIRFGIAGKSAESFPRIDGLDYTAVPMPPGFVVTRD